MQTINWRIFTEIIASLSIVVSLVFVGLEIRENSAIAASDSYNQFALAVSETQLAAALDPELASLFQRTISPRADDPEITRDERFQMILFFQSALRIWEGMYRSIDEGILSESDLNIITNYAGMLRNPTFRFYWSEYGGRTQYLPGFSNYIEQLLAEG